MNLFLASRNFLSKILISKIGVAHPKKGFLTKSVSNPYGRAMTIPTALELRK